MNLSTSVFVEVLGRFYFITSTSERTAGLDYARVKSTVMNLSWCEVLGSGR